jgi:hypothetical protein
VAPATLPAQGAAATRPRIMASGMVFEISSDHFVQDTESPVRVNRLKKSHDNWDALGPLGSSNLA